MVTRSRAASERAVRDIVSRMTARLDEVGAELGARYRSEIADYSTLDDEVLYGDVVSISLENLRAFLANLENGGPVGTAELNNFRESGARRVHQGVGLESLLHAYRLWGQTVWQAVVNTARVNRPHEREAALMVAGRIIEHINVVSTVVARGYLDEAEGVWSDREVVRRDLLEAVISGGAASASVRREARSLNLHLSDSYVVILARNSQLSRDEVRTRPLSARAAMRGAVESIKQHLRASSSSLLVGLRHDEVVALYPIDNPNDLEKITAQCTALASEIGSEGFQIGVGGWHPGPGGVGTSYGEAEEALEIAVKSGSRGQPVIFKDVLLDHVLRSNPKSKRFLTETLTPVTEYDARNGTELVATLRAYVDSGFNITKAAALLCVHPNTVVYRLKRTKELTGRDPHVSRDLLLLSLALKLIDVP